ncbi:MAG: hypothetical protein NT094_00250, partial [Candidatus Staskawiczbacteria bacterium]|nr:hypothetical protein [Candidatus Staskawiczbacteria bacterium]
MKKIIKILILVLAILVILITGIFFVVNQKYSKIANYFKPSIEQKVVKVIGDTTCTNNSDCVLAEAD